MIAEAIYFNERSRQRLGDRLMWLFAARLVPVSRWQRISQNIIPVDHVGLDDAAKERIVETLRRDHVNAILSIPATHLSLARFIEARGIASDGFGLSVVLSTGENLDPTMKRRLESAFGCPVVNRYGNEENGFLACSVPGEDGLRLNRANYLFEFLKPESDEPQPSGDLARVVITDLYNYAMPFIRYDTGDLAIVADHGGEGPTMLLSVEGRRIDVIYDTSGGQITSPSVSGVMSRGFPELEGYQLIQDGASSYRLRVALGSKAYGEPELVAVLRKWLGTDAQITVSFEPRIASLASGKHRPVLCEYSPDD
jgi:phenylacetate-CoA ligase